MGGQSILQHLTIFTVWGVPGPKSLCRSASCCWQMRRNGTKLCSQRRTLENVCGLSGTWPSCRSESLASNRASVIRLRLSKLLAKQVAEKAILPQNDFGSQPGCGWKMEMLRWLHRKAGWKGSYSQNHPLPAQDRTEIPQRKRLGTTKSHASV